MVLKLVLVLALVCACFAYPAEEPVIPQVQALPPEGADQPNVSVASEGVPVKTVPVTVTGVNEGVLNKPDPDLKTDSSLWWRSYNPYPRYAYPRVFTYYTYPSYHHRYWHSYW